MGRRGCARRVSAPLLSGLSYAEYAALTPVEQSVYDRAVEGVSPVLDLALLEEQMHQDQLGRASIGDVLCKIWLWIVKAAKSVISGISEVLKSLVSAVFDVLGELFDGAGSSLFDSTFGRVLIIGGLIWAASALGLFDKKDEEDEDGIVASYLPGGE